VVFAGLVNGDDGGRAGGHPVMTQNTNLQ